MAILNLDFRALRDWIKFRETVFLLVNNHIGRQTPMALQEILYFASDISVNEPSRFDTKIVTNLFVKIPYKHNCLYLRCFFYVSSRLPQVSFTHR